MAPTQTSTPTTDRAPDTRALPDRAPRLWWYPYGRPELAERMY